MQDGVLMISSYDTNPCIETRDPNDPHVIGYAYGVVVQIVDFNSNVQLDCTAIGIIKYDWSKWPHPIMPDPWAEKEPQCNRLSPSTSPPAQAFNIDAKNSAVMVYALRARPALPEKSVSKLNFVWAYDRRKPTVRVCVLFYWALPHCKEALIHDWDPNAAPPKIEDR
jgi:hypothetical protein